MSGPDTAGFSPGLVEVGAVVIRENTPIADALAVKPSYSPLQDPPLLPACHPAAPRRRPAVWSRRWT